MYASYMTITIIIIYVRGACTVVCRTCEGTAGRIIMTAAAARCTHTHRENRP